MIYLVELLLILYAVDDELLFLGDDGSIMVGWLIVSLCLLIIVIQLLVNMKMQFEFYKKKFVSFRKAM